MEMHERKPWGPTKLEPDEADDPVEMRYYIFPDGPDEDENEVSE